MCCCALHSGFRWVQKSMRISASGSVPTRTAKPQHPSPSSSPSSPSQASSPTSSPTTKRQQPSKTVTEVKKRALLDHFWNQVTYHTFTFSSFFAKRATLTRVQCKEWKNCSKNAMKIKMDRYLFPFDSPFNMKFDNNDSNLFLPEQISKRELWNFLHKQGVEPSKEEFLSLFSELDEDDQGSLTFKQFVKGIQGLSKVGFVFCTKYIVA